MSASDPAPLALTIGDPAGIGPDLVLTVAAQHPDWPLVALGDKAALSARAAQLGLRCPLSDWQPGEAVNREGLSVWHSPCASTVVAGQADNSNASAILNTLDRAAAGCLDGTFSAMVTAPLSKQVICEGARPDFTGHTEYLAQRGGVDRVVMMLATDTLRVALATTHLPLRDVASAITPASLTTTLEILDRDLKQRFAIAEPRILVLGLNPHAGEGGHLGREELDIITPTLDALRNRGLSLTGPVPADTAFVPALLDEHDAVLAMYHDQGLPVLKYAGFGRAVNITLGLPFVRTSVDHGTAFELAGSGRAYSGSLVAATRLALQMAGHGSFA